ncbi:hypothetical protein GALMADRAFT_242248 [Galerina marginata CBS 339.88]|uniref:F-box domain-containing protein n=1 Tax=Galerina marginata (strain CBS 339.88) TaxID=685588 RepID=A0A067TA14_GALM3|nr:hypothetical protein GALMADRAFT_242248 [Galerina marginata CBS 339.88]
MGLLPPELLRLVMEDLKSEHRTLQALTLTSKGLRWEATRLLYVSMTAASGTTHFKFLSTIRKLPTELAPLVRVYHLPTIPHAGTRGQNCVWNLVLQCLPLMVNLKELAFHKIIGSPSRLFPSWGKGRRATFQLDKFSWTGEGCDPNHTRIYEEQALSFLETQHEMTQLHLLSSASSFPANACPKLKRLDGNIQAIGTVLRSRSVKELRWLNLSRLSSLSIYDVMMMTELRALRAISVESYFYLRMLMNLPSNHPRFVSLFNVEALEVLVSDASVDAFFIIADLAPKLPQFRRLRKLVITAPEGGARFPGPAPEIHLHQLYAFEQCPELKSIDISWDSGPIYRRWVDGVPLPELLSIHRDKILELE